MKISNSKKELARIISENGGWRDGEFAAQDGDGGVGGYGVKPEWASLAKYWWREASGQWFLANKIKNHHQTVLSRAEFFHLYPAPDADGWIEWNGGECPVERGTFVDIKDADGKEWFAVKAAPQDEYSDAANEFWEWSCTECNRIVAYRLHNPDAVKPEFCESVMRTIPESEAKPTIEQLAADYRNAKDFAERKQREADSAKADADEKLRVLELAGEALGLLVTPITSKQEPELVINDWRDLQVGDEIEVFNFECPESESRRKQELMSGPCVVMQVESGNVCIELKKNLPTKGSHWNATGIDTCDFKFIRRP